MKIACYASGSVGTNCYVVSDDAGVTAIIDCDGNPAPLFSYIEKNELKPTHILLTHGHFDHIGSVNEVAEKYGCTVVGCAKEMRVFTDASVNCSAFCGGAVTVYPDVQVNDGDVVKVGDMEFRVMLTPGHTEGSVCYISGSVMFSGDSCDYCKSKFDLQDLKGKVSSLFESNDNTENRRGDRKSVV